MQESITAPPTNEDLQEGASALLEAIVRAEVELQALQERCGSLELAISLGREAVATAESLPAEAPATKSTSGKGTQERSPAPEENSPPPDPAMPPIKPPKPLSIPKPQPAMVEQKDPEKDPETTAKPVLEPVAAASAPETAESRAAASASLEEQAAALRAAMGAQSAPAAEEPTANEAPRSSGGEPTKTEAPPAAAPDPVEHEPRPFKPKRSTPLKSRLAGLDVNAAETESESYSERSAELEQLLRTRDEG